MFSTIIGSFAALGTKSFIPLGLASSKLVSTPTTNVVLPPSATSLFIQTPSLPSLFALSFAFLTAICIPVLALRRCCNTVSVFCLLWVAIVATVFGSGIWACISPLSVLGNAFLVAEYAATRAWPAGLSGFVFFYAHILLHGLGYVRMIGFAVLSHACWLTAAPLLIRGSRIFQKIQPSLILFILAALVLPALFDASSYRRLMWLMCYVDSTQPIRNISTSFGRLGVFQPFPSTWTTSDIAMITGPASLHALVLAIASASYVVTHIPVFALRILYNWDALILNIIISLLYRGFIWLLCSVTLVLVSVVYSMDHSLMAFGQRLLRFVLSQFALVNPPPELLHATRGFQIWQTAQSLELAAAKHELWVAIVDRAGIAWDIWHALCFAQRLVIVAPVIVFYAKYHVIPLVRRSRAVITSGPRQRRLLRIQIRQVTKPFHEHD
ncbi:hypothetical protein MIND_00667500 [Mycena indigotica]|uniref:Uncharacterized protein n=1 Tax=Mycena indigotica TaxID=2126181 RepID=A0A8H6W112_9AGAR|nr:uncharacterized protein MIND_00667500 [Mycena indigotica]KAF7301037.1 hypothetical protein MIND_00667500 [Mycena indigotica]